MSVAGQALSDYQRYVETRGDPMCEYAISLRREGDSAPKQVNFGFYGYKWAYQDLMATFRETYSPWGYGGFVIVSASTGRKCRNRMDVELVNGACFLAKRVPITAVYDAVAARQIWRVRELLDDGENPNFLNGEERGKSNLHKAVEERDDEIVAELIRKGADVEAMDLRGCTPLFYAAGLDYKSFDMDCLVVLVQNGALLEIADADGRTPLHHCARMGRVDAVELLLDNEAEKEVVDKDGYTPLVTAVINDREDVVNCLLGRGAKVDRRDVTGMTVLHHAADHGHLKYIPVLLDHGADVSIRDDEFRSPLHFLCDASDSIPSLTEMKRIVSLLNKRTTDGKSPVEAQDRSGWTPMHFAAAADNTVALQALLSLVDRSVVDMMEESREKRLLEWDAPVAPGATLTDVDGRTPLHLAVWNGHLEATKLLVAQGVVLVEQSLIPDLKGKTPQQIAVERSHPQIVKILDQTQQRLWASKAEKENKEIEERLRKEIIQQAIQQRQRQEIIHVQQQKKLINSVESSLQEKNDRLTDELEKTMKERDRLVEQQNSNDMQVLHSMVNELIEKMTECETKIRVVMNLYDVTVDLSRFKMRRKRGRKMLVAGKIAEAMKKVSLFCEVLEHIEFERRRTGNNGNASSGDSKRRRSSAQQMSQTEVVRTNTTAASNAVFMLSSMASKAPNRTLRKARSSPRGSPYQSPAQSPRSSPRSSPRASPTPKMPRPRGPTSKPPSSPAAAEHLMKSKLDDAGEKPPSALRDSTDEQELLFDSVGEVLGEAEALAKNGGKLRPQLSVSVRRPSMESFASSEANSPPASNDGLTLGASSMILEADEEALADSSPPQPQPQPPRSPADSSPEADNSNVANEGDAEAHAEDDVPSDPSIRPSAPPRKGDYVPSPHAVLASISPSRNALGSFQGHLVISAVPKSLRPRQERLSGLGLPTRGQVLHLSSEDPTNEEISPRQSGKLGTPPDVSDSIVGSRPRGGRRVVSVSISRKPGPPELMQSSDLPDTSPTEPLQLSSALLRSTVGEAIDVNSESMSLKSLASLMDVFFRSLHSPQLSRSLRRTGSDDDDDDVGTVLVGFLNSRYRDPGRAAVAALRVVHAVERYRSQAVEVFMFARFLENGWGCWAGRAYIICMSMIRSFSPNSTSPTSAAPPKIRLRLPLCMMCVREVVSRLCGSAKQPVLAVVANLYCTLLHAANVPDAPPILPTDACGVTTDDIARLEGWFDQPDEYALSGITMMIHVCEAAEKFRGLVAGNPMSGNTGSRGVGSSSIQSSDLGHSVRGLSNPISLPTAAPRARSGLPSSSLKATSAAAFGPGRRNDLYHAKSGPVTFPANVSSSTSSSAVNLPHEPLNTPRMFGAPFGDMSLLPRAFVHPNMPPGQSLSLSGSAGSSVGGGPEAAELTNLLTTSPILRPRNAPHAHRAADTLSPQYPHSARGHTAHDFTIGGKASSQESGLGQVLAPQRPSSSGFPHTARL
eukprot:Rmarinus@m.21670